MTAKIGSFFAKAKWYILLALALFVSLLGIRTLYLEKKAAESKARALAAQSKRNSKLHAEKIARITASIADKEAKDKKVQAADAEFEREAASIRGEAKKAGQRLEEKGLAEYWEGKLDEAGGIAGWTHPGKS